MNKNVTVPIEDWRNRPVLGEHYPYVCSALMPVYISLRHVADPQWGNKKHMNMKHLEEAIEDNLIKANTMGCPAHI